jgi:hypothetical protein
VTCLHDIQKGDFMKIALSMLLFVAVTSPILADSQRAHHYATASVESSGITCDTVRAYVSQVGLAVAKAMARANGMTAVQERRARQCLARGD